LEKEVPLLMEIEQAGWLYSSILSNSDGNNISYNTSLTMKKKHSTSGIQEITAFFIMVYNNLRGFYLQKSDNNPIVACFLSSSV